MRRLDRYVLSEVLGPLGLGLLVYTFILLVQRFFALAEMIIRRGVPAGTVAQLLLYSLPNIVVLTLPMALLLGVLLGIGRLASDSELIAMRASGRSLAVLLRPVLALSFLLAALNVGLMLYALPLGNQAYTTLLVDMVKRTVGQQFEPRVFYNEFQGKTLWVFDVRPDGTWEGVVLADSIPAETTKIVVARRGALEVDSAGERVVLRLEDAVEHSYDFAQPDRYQMSAHQTTRILLRDRFASQERERLMSRKSTKSMTFEESRQLAADPTVAPELRILGRVEMHKKFSIPAACVVLGLLAVPLGFTNRRGGKSTGFALSIAIVVLYHFLITQGEEAARVQLISPALAMWLPNLLLGVAGLVLVYWKDRDRPPLLRRWLESPPWRRVVRAIRRTTAWLGGRGRGSWRRLREHGSGRREKSRTRSRPPSQGSIRFLVPRPRLRFPNRLDRYVLGVFGGILALVLLSGISLSMIADFTENVDDILKNRPGVPVLLRYYKFQAMQMGYEVAPIAALVTTLVTFGLLARHNEVIAARALGISLYRLGVPALVGAAALGAFSVFLQAQVLPASNQKVAEAKDVIKGRAPQRAIRSPDRQWLFAQGRYLYNFLHFDARSDGIQRLQVFEFDSRHRLVARLLAEEARHTAAGWVFVGGWSRRFEGNRSGEFVKFDGAVRSDLPEAPEFFSGQQPKPQQMTYGQLRRHVSDLRDAGQRRPELEVALQNKLAYPAGAVVMALVALPFAFRLERRGALHGLGVAIVLGMIFMAVFALFKTLGDVGVFPAEIAVWSPSLLFTILSAYLFLGVRS